jgi:hypothetical protein
VAVTSVSLLPAFRGLLLVSGHSSVFLHTIKGMCVLRIHQGDFATELSTDADRSDSAD